MEYKYKKELNNVLVTLFNFYLGYIVLGMIMGFKSNYYSLKPISIIRNIFKPLLLILVVEYVRYYIVKINKKRIVIIVTVVIILMDIVIGFRRYYVSNIYYGVVWITKILNIVGYNVLLTYLYGRYDMKIGVLYKVIIKIFIYFQLVVPSISEWVVEVGLFLLSYYIYMNIDNDRMKIRRFSIIVFLFYIVLYSDFFNIRLLPVYYSHIDNIMKSDAVIVKNDKVKKEDYILYYDNNKYIVSQVVKIDYIDDIEYYFVMTDNDSEYALVLDDNLCGVVIRTMPYMGSIPVLVSDIKEMIEEYLLLMIECINKDWCDVFICK